MLRVYARVPEALDGREFVRWMDRRHLRRRGPQQEAAAHDKQGQRGERERERSAKAGGAHERGGRDTGGH